MNKVAIASDHAGYDLKEFFKKNIRNVSWEDLGPGDRQSVDYPDYAKKLSNMVVSKSFSWGVLICGSGVGMSMAANRIKGIRAVLAHSEFAAKLSRAHNDSNVLCLGARVTAPEYAEIIFQAWMNTTFEGGRHQTRILKME